MEQAKQPSFSDRLKEAGYKIKPSIIAEGGRILVGNEVLSLQLGLANIERTHLESALLADRDQLLSRISELEEQLRRDRSINEILASPAWRQVLDEKLKSDPENVGVLFFDITNFKRANDLMGQTQADKLLRDIALAILEGTRETDICGFVDDPTKGVGRLGGDEFAVLLDLSPRHESDELTQNERLMTVKDRFMEKIEDIHQKRPELRKIYKVDIATGYACGKKGYSSEQLIAHAEVSMKLQKKDQHSALGSYRQV